MIMDNTFSDFFQVIKGYWSKNLLSCLIFILVIEILLIKLNNSQILNPVNVTLSNNGLINERTLSFADDINCLVNNNETELKNLKRILDDFGLLSNLKLNEKKTKLCPIGRNINDNIELNIDHLISFDNSDDREENWSIALKKCYYMCIL